MKRFVVAIVTLITTAAPAVVLAAPSEAALSVYWSRPDLQEAFDSSTYRAIPGSTAGFLIDLEDWAWQYGWREAPELAAYAPSSAPVRTGRVSEPVVTDDVYVVLDRTSGQVLAAQRAGEVWPIASLTKLVTSDVVLDSEVAPTSISNILGTDDVGGAKLYVNSGDTFSVDDLFYATLVASANNAANALSRTSGLNRNTFIAQMNLRAQDMNLSYTRFVDPTGIEVENVSTAREFSRLANRIFSRPDIQRYTTTAEADVEVISQGVSKHLTNTNWMLWKPEYDDIFVMAGKTGYLDESGWNLAVCLRPNMEDEERELLIVSFGADSRAESFVDARALAEWTWDNYTWEEKTDSDI